MIPRKLEPEVMDSPEEARDYDSMDHGEVNRIFVGDLLAAAKQAALTPRSPRVELDVLDCGTGTAQIPIELCRRALAIKVTAIDLAVHMLDVARRNIATAELEHSIHLELADAKNLSYEDACFDAVVSNSIVHHIPEPRAALAEMVRVLRPGGLLFVRDLLRPADRDALEELVQTYAGNANAHQQQMFRDSLGAALTIEEVRALLAELEIPPAWVSQTSDRHWTIRGTP